MPHAAAIYLAQGGQDSESESARLDGDQFARGVNVGIAKQRPGTRPRARCIPLSGDGAGAFASENVQGAMFFNPAAGQGAVSFGLDESTILVSAGGRKLSIALTGRGSETRATITDVSNGFVSDPNLHLVHWSQWENYALAGDGNGNTWIWDGFNPAFASAGYNNVDKEKSRVPNGATAMFYAHGRGAVVVDSRAVLVGDLLNSRSLTTSEDVLSFREQSYWATGQYFAPPSRLGAILAAETLPQRDSQHGHGDVMIHCERGIFSVDLNVFPRAKWSETPMVKTAYEGGAATGPYAVTKFDGDQLFRSQVGVQTLRSAAAESSLIGNPQQPISDVVCDFFKADSPRYLRFASVASWESQRRALVTCYPIVHGRYRWHRGAVSVNFDPVPVKTTPPAWEGLWTLPPGMSGIVQFVSGTWDAEKRLFAICRASDGTNKLVEFRNDIDDDVLEDGTRVRVRSQLQTRKVDMDEVFTDKQVNGGTLYLSGVTGRVDWGVWFRRYGSKKWTPWRAGFVDNSPTCEEGLLCERSDWEGPLTLGSLPTPKGPKSARHFQFLIRWAGKASVEGLRLLYQDDTNREDEFKTQSLGVVVGYGERRTADYSDYEYAEVSEAESWLHVQPGGELCSPATASAPAASSCATAGGLLIRPQTSNEANFERLLFWGLFPVDHP